MFSDGDGTKITIIRTQYRHFLQYWSSLTHEGQERDVPAHWVANFEKYLDIWLWFKQYKEDVEKSPAILLSWALRASRNGYANPQSSSFSRLCWQLSILDLDFGQIF